MGPSPSPSPSTGSSTSPRLRWAAIPPACRTFPSRCRTSRTMTRSSRTIPASWPLRFDLTNWGLLGAYDGTRRIGGAVLAYDTPGLDLLLREHDALLWDLRVAPDRRGHGVGTALFAAAESWARRRECHRLLVETQDSNPRACRFYIARGCRLMRVTRGAYADFPSETQLLWEKSLTPLSRVRRVSG